MAKFAIIGLLITGILAYAIYSYASQPVDARRISVQEVRRLSDRAYLEFLGEHGLSSADFGKPRITYVEQAGVWQVFYEAAGSSSFVSIMVDGFENTELHYSVK